MAFADKYRKGSAARFGSQYRKDKSGVAPISRAPIIPKRTPIQETDRYKQAARNAEIYQEAANKESSLKGMALNALKAAPRAAADVLVGTPAKFIASTAEIPGIVSRKGATTQRTYNVPGLTPFKSYQSDFENVANDVIEGKAGLGRAAWELAKVPLAGLETAGLARGINAAVKNRSIMPLVDNFIPRNTVSSKNLGNNRLLSARPSQLPQSKSSYQTPVRDTVENARLGSYSDTIPQNLSTARKAVTSGEAVLARSGKEGQQLSELMKQEQVAADLQAGEWKSVVKKFTQQLDDNQKANLVDVLEGKDSPMDASVAASSKVMRNLLNKVQRTAKETGLDVGYRKDYFPRQYNWDEITKGKRHEEILKHMVDTGQAKTPAEAENFLRDFIGKNRERKAGNLEYERLYDIPGYERDPEKALTAYADSAAKRITEAKMFGKKDEIPSNLINKIAEGGGDYREAQKIFDYVYKGEPKNAFAQFLLGYNTFTKLSLGFFSNITQSANTAAKGGLLNTIKGAGQALAQGVKAIRKQDYDDLAVLANTLDDHISVQESGLSNKFIKGAMYLFQKVEQFNRRTATYAGKYRAEELVNVLNADPNSAFAARQLESLGIPVKDIVSGKLTDKQILTAANKMVRTTQFKIDAINLPTMWRGPLGKVLMQFKSFSFMQTKFIRDEILKEAKNGNLAPLARFIVIAPVASYVTQSARNWVNRVDPDNEKANPSFRRGDLYRKAVGDLPSDFATQMKYAYDKSQATYQDAKGNVYPSTTLLQDIRNFSSPFIGPSGGDMAQLAASLDKVSAIKERNNAWYANHEAAQSDPYLDLKRFVATKIPFVGRGITNTFFPYQKTMAKQAKEVFKEGVEKNDRNLINQAMEMDPYLFNERVVQNIIGKKIKDMTLEEKKLYQEIKDKRASNQPFFSK